MHHVSLESCKFVFDPATSHYYSLEEILSRVARGKLITNNTVTECIIKYAVLDGGSTTKEILKNEEKIIRKVSPDLLIGSGEAYIVTKKALDIFPKFFELPLFTKGKICKDRAVFLAIRNFKSLNLLELATMEISVPVARYIFRELLKKVYILHQNHIVHSNLRLENIGVDMNGNVSITEYSSARELEGFITNFYISPPYSPPEVYLQMPLASYYPIDIFSLGVVLFAVLYRRYPFHDASPANPGYRYFASSNEICFWDLLKQDMELGKFVGSHNLMDLLAQMLSATPELRPSLSEVLQHPWVQESIADLVEIKNNLKKLYHEHSINKS